MQPPRIIFIYGPVASGKFTIGKELAALSGIRLFHNHLTVDLLLSVFPFGHPAFVRLREAVWLEVMGEAIGSGVSLIFTFTPERTVSPDFPTMLVRRVAQQGGTIAFVEVRCPNEEIERRLALSSRGQFQKLTSLPDYRSLKAAGAFEYPLIRPECVVESGKLTPSEAARFIVTQLELSDAKNA
jgi:hypothetical protein